MFGMKFIIWLENKGEDTFEYEIEKNKFIVNTKNVLTLW